MKCVKNEKIELIRQMHGWTGNMAAYAYVDENVKLKLAYSTEIALQLELQY